MTIQIQLTGYPYSMLKCNRFIRKSLNENKWYKPAHHLLEVNTAAESCSTRSSIELDTLI